MAYNPRHVRVYMAGWGVGGWGGAACLDSMSGDNGQEADNALGLAPFCGSLLCWDSIMCCLVC